MSFSTLGLENPLLGTLARLGLETPTPVQEQSIPIALDGRDLVASAETGSGKTAAFLLPILARLLAGKRSGGTRALILVPTRELAIQVRDVALELSEGTSIGCVVVYGGVGMESQTKALRLGVDIVVATPGRLLDHANRGNTRFNHMQCLVLDEADRMLDMGFLPDIKRIMALLPRGRQTLLFSATMPDAIAKLAREVLHEPERVRIGHARRPAVPDGITQAVYPVVAHHKGALLVHLLKRGGMESTVIFCRTKRRADRLVKLLAREGFRSGVLHGDRSQNQRERALQGFREGRLPILVATDLAARGLDVDGITHVVNYDVPRTPEDYIHRVGRTARAEAKGDAISLASSEEMPQITAIERELGSRIPRPKLPEFETVAAMPKASGNHRTWSKPGGGGGGRTKSRGKGRGGAAAPGKPKSQKEFWQRVNSRRGKGRG